ncbi:MAG: M28 family peptidase [Chloroflexi bacterium]|nr:M28 family peptidase [Chloroflexota bacterium]
MTTRQRLQALEARLLAAISGPRLMDYNRMTAAGIRLSGNADERQVFADIQQEMARLGYRTRLLEHPGYVSWPDESSITVEGSGEEIGPSIPHAMAASTPPEGLAAEAVYVGASAPAGYRQVDVRGRVAILEGLAMPETVALAEAQGCVAVVAVSDEYLHQMIVSTVWGNPTPETEPRLPQIPVVSVPAPAGARLRALLAQGPLRLRLHAQVETGWKMLPLLVADLPAPWPTPRYVLLSGHVDSWWHGAMDNGGANATMVEVANVLAQERAHWQRGLRLAFWSGHSHGRYAGSTWYADHCWADLEQNAVVHINVDGTGAHGADNFTTAPCMAETRRMATDLIKELTGQDYAGHRMSRAGDQSFWGVGMPSLFMNVSSQPDGSAGWWWHTEHDTMEQIAEANLVRDTQAYALAVARFVTRPVLPLDFVDVADEFLAMLEGLQAQAGAALDLGPALVQAAALRARASALMNVAQAVGRSAASAADPRAAAVNACFMRLSRLLVPVSYSSADRFHQSPAVPIPPLPGLQAVAELAALAPRSHPFRLLETRLVRERNRVCHALAEATAAIEETLRRL